MTNTTRIATVKATGKRYIVQRLSIGRTPAESKCFCWGEVSSYKGGASKHEASKTFLMSAVEVAEVAKTPALMASLFEQTIQGRRDAGHVIVAGRRGYTDCGTVEQLEARKASLQAREAADPAFVDFLAELGDIAPDLTRKVLAKVEQRRERQLNAVNAALAIAKQ